MKSLYLIFFSFLMLSCGVMVSVDYDKEIDFSKYHTFNFYPDIESGLSYLEDQRIIHVADSLLQERGFDRSENPDFLINFFAEEIVQNSRNTMGVSIGSSSRNSHIGISGGIPIGDRIINQYLTVDFVDAKKDLLVLRAEASGEYKEHVTPKRKKQYYISVLEKVFKNFPPE